MPSSRFLISSQTLGSAAASVTFSSIPSGYADLVLRISSRTTYTGFTFDQINLLINGDTASNYSRTQLRGNGAAAASGGLGNQTVLDLPQTTDTDLATSNTFSSFEMYIPSYTVSQSKPSGIFSAQETNATTAYINAFAALWRNNAAVTSISLTPANGSFVSTSSFYLYGIKNS
jgi:hypothetical protein